jgi:hypothetical protein
LVVVPSDSGSCLRTVPATNSSIAGREMTTLHLQLDLFLQAILADRGSDVNILRLHS